MVNIMDGNTIRVRLVPANLPPGISKKEITRQIDEIATRALLRCQMAESGPFPYPDLDTSLVAKLKKFLSSLLH